MANYGYEELSSALPVQSVYPCVPLPYPDKQIRVLDLDPVHSESPSVAQALHGRLRILSDSADDEYVALSYVWRQEDPGTLKRENRLIIHCNDHQHVVPLRPNCWSALWHLCRIKRPLPLRIWADSICIDQNNDEEKKQQISRMSAIYISAQTTYFWLGEATKDTNKAMDFLSSHRITMNTQGVGNILLIAIKIFTYRRYPYRSGLQEIFGRQWIKRLWTLQECLLSSNGFIVCGEKLISWGDFVCALESIDYFHDHPWSLLFDGSYLPWLNLAKLTQWFAEESSNSPDGVPSNLRHPVSKFQAHLDCLKWATRIIFFLGLLFYLAALITALIAGLFDFVLSLFTDFFLSGSNARAVRLFFPRTPHSILEELQNRDVWDPKDRYNGMVGIFGDDASNTGESLYVVYRRLCTSLICTTKSLDVLLSANTCVDNNYRSWVINWDSTMPQIWGRAIYYMEKRSSIGVIPDLWNFEPRTSERKRLTLSRFDPIQGIIFLRIYNQ